MLDKIKLHICQSEIYKAANKKFNKNYHIRVTTTTFTKTNVVHATSKADL
jgi:hypothetical protein